MGIIVRPAEPADAAAIAAIYNVEVTQSTVTFDLVPRSLEEQRRWIDEHSGAYSAVVAVDQATDEVVGFGSISRWRERPAYSTSAEDSVYVRNDQRGRGVGRAVLEELVRQATAHGFHAVFARIADARPASIALHRACGFEAVGLEREVGRKFGRWLDVAVLERLL